VGRQQGVLRLVCRHFRRDMRRSSAGAGSRVQARRGPVQWRASRTAGPAADSASVENDEVGLSGDEVLLRFSVPGPYLVAASLLLLASTVQRAQSVSVVPGARLGAPAFKTLMERFPLQPKHD